MKKEKIIFWESLSHIAGGQRVLLNLLPFFVKDFSATVIIPENGEFSHACKDIDADIVYIQTGSYSLGKKTFSDVLSFIFRTPGIIFQGIRVCRGADIIYVNSTRVLPWAVIIGSILRIPILWHSHILLSDKKTQALTRFFGSFPIVKRIIAVSEVASRQFSEFEKKTEIVKNSVDIDKFQPMKEILDSRSGAGMTEGEWGGNETMSVPQTIWRIGIVGDIVPQKGHSTLLKAASILQKQGKDFCISVIGKPRENSISYREELERESSNLLLQDKIEFLGQLKDMQNIYSKFDLIVVSSLVPETCSLVICETLACGVPVIGSRIGAIPELISDGQTGYLFEAGNSEDLAEKIILFFSDSEKIRLMKKQCRQYAEENFNLEEMYKRIKKIIQEIS